jgi:putative ABC transport system permease protein
VLGHAAAPADAAIPGDGAVLGLIATNLARRWGRAALTALGVGIGVAMIVGLLSLTQGLKDSAAGLVHLGGSDLGVFQSNVSDPTASVLPASLVDRLAARRDVARATPLVLVVDAIAGDPGAVAFGADPAGFFTQRLVMIHGRRGRGAEVVVGDRLAQTRRLRPGGTLTVRGRGLRVAGVYHAGIYFEDAGAVMALNQAQALVGRAGEETAIAVQLAPKARPRPTARAIERAFPGTQVISDPEEAARAGANATLISKAVLAIAVVALLIGGFSVMNTLAMAVIERQGELGLLSTVGWSPPRVAALILGEGVAVSLVGAGAGLLLGVLGSGALVHLLGVSGYVSASVTAWGLGRGLLVGIAIGVLGGVYPAWRVTRMRPVKALARG